MAVTRRRRRKRRRRRRRESNPIPPWTRRLSRCPLTTATTSSKPSNRWSFVLLMLMHMHNTHVRVHVHADNNDAVQVHFKYHIQIMFIIMLMLVLMFMFWTLERGLRRALIRCTFGFREIQGRVGILEGRTRGSNGTQRGAVYKQPGTEVDDSCHNWRVPSK